MVTILKHFLIIFLFITGFVFQETSICKEIASPIKSEFIFEKNPQDTPFVHAPTIAETGSGLVAAWFGGTGEGNSDTKIFVSRLSRDLKSWTVPAVAATGNNEKDPAACWNPVLFQQRNGPLYLFYKTGKDPENWKGFFKVSLDDGRTWSSPNPLPDGILGPAKNKPIELADGTILCPSSVQSQGLRRVFIEKIHPKSSNDLLLRNKWFRIGPLNNDSMMVIQPAILNFGKGQMLLLSRNKRLSLFLFQSIMESRSSDDGMTWSTMSPSHLPNPNSGIDATVLQDGRAMLVFNPSRIRRTPLDIAVSTDQGRVWIDSLRLENGLGEYSYPSITQTMDGLIHIVYSWKRSKIKHVVIDPKLI